MVWGSWQCESSLALLGMARVCAGADELTIRLCASTVRLGQMTNPTRHVVSSADWTVLFVGMMHLFYVVWDYIDERLFDKRNTSDCSQFSELLGWPTSGTCLYAYCRLFGGRSAHEKSSDTLENETIRDVLLIV